MVTRRAAGIQGDEEQQEGIPSSYLLSVVPNSSFKINDHVAILVYQNVSVNVSH